MDTPNDLPTGGVNMNLTGYLFLNLLSFAASIFLFLSTIRFGDNIIAFFKK